MANWNLMAKLFSTLGLTAFSVGFTGMAVKGMKGGCCNNCGSIFGGGFGFMPYNNNYNMFNTYNNYNMFNSYNNFDFSNPYAFLNSNINPANSITRTNSTNSVKKAQSAPPPTRCRN